MRIPALITLAVSCLWVAGSPNDWIHVVNTSDAPINVVVGFNDYPATSPPPFPGDGWATVASFVVPANDTVAWQSTCCFGDNPNAWYAIKELDGLWYTSPQVNAEVVIDTGADLFFEVPVVGNWKIDKRICNDQSAFPTKFIVKTNGVAIASQTLQPGECWDFHYLGPDKILLTVTSEVTITSSDGDNLIMDEDTVVAEVTDEGWHQGDSPIAGAVSAAVGNVVPVDHISQTNRSIAFPTQGTNSQGATEETLKIGASAIAKATLDGASKVQSAVNAAAAKIDGLATNLSGVRSAITNLPANAEGYSTSRLASLTANITNDSRTLAFAKGAEASNTFNAGIASIGGAPLATAYAGSEEYYTVALGQWSMNLDPRDHPKLAGLAGWFKNIVTWVSTFFFLLLSWATINAAVTAVMAAPQATGSPQAVWGFNISAPLAFTAAGIIFLIWVGITLSVGIWFTDNSPLLGLLHTSPFSAPGGGAMTGALGAGIELAFAYLPVDTVILYAVSLLILRMTSTGMMMGGCVAIRFVIG